MLRINIQLLVLIISLSYTISALADIYSYKNPASQYIKVVESEAKDAVKFSICEHLESRVSRCKSIGAKDKFYPKITLKLLRESEKFDVVTSVIADAALVAGGIYAGAGIGSALGYSVATSSMPLFYVESGAVIGASSAVAISTVVDALNPYEQIKQLETITDDVLKDKFVIVQTELNDFAERLEVVLTNLDNHLWITIKNGVFQSIMLRGLEK